MGWLKTLSDRRAKLEQELVHVVALQRMAEGEEFTPGGNGDEPDPNPAPKPRRKKQARKADPDAVPRTKRAHNVMAIILEVLRAFGEPMSSLGLYRAVQERVPGITWKTPTVNLSDFAKRSKGRIRRAGDDRWRLGDETDAMNEE